VNNIDKKQLGSLELSVSFKECLISFLFARIFRCSGKCMLAENKKNYLSLTGRARYYYHGPSCRRCRFLKFSLHVHALNRYRSIVHTGNLNEYAAADAAGRVLLFTAWDDYQWRMRLKFTLPLAEYRDSNCWTWPGEWKLARHPGRACVTG